MAATTTTEATTIESRYATFEAKQAQEWNATQADQIHWEREAAYRNQNYRYLYHQQGLIGTFHVRLLEASDLKRSYWSALAIGPVKLLGWSKAHGAVSSFVSFTFDPEAETAPVHRTEETSSAATAEVTSLRTPNMDTKKPAANKLPVGGGGGIRARPCFVSPVAPNDDNPVWTNTYFHLPLKKGVLLKDGQPIILQLRVDEDATAVENLLPGVPSGGDSRLLGTGEVDLTSLCLGQMVENGQPQVGVLDTWVPIYLRRKHQEKQREDAEATLRMLNNNNYDPVVKKKPSSQADGGEENNPTGRVRVLVSYEPYGMEPQPHDIVALEVFARQDVRAASCRPILPPRLPLHVLETSGPWLLVEYHLFGGSSGGSGAEKACLKIHRNAVFVIERKNIIDSTLNLALLPADFFLSTALGKTTRQLVSPLWVAGNQLLAPAIFSSRLAWVAIRTTALASLTGVHAATRAFVSEGASSMTRNNENPNRNGVVRNGANHHKLVTL